MKLKKNNLFRSGDWLGLCVIWMACGWMGNAQGFSTTSVQGTVYSADGKPGTGTLQLSWPAFTTSTNQAVAGGRKMVTIGADGFVSVSLSPNVGATPAGLYYTAIYNLSDGTTSTEYWVVPAAAQASLGQVRAQLMPAAQAVQAVSKRYVDQSVQELTQSLLTASGGSLSGPLFLNGDPQMPTQAASKHYVDTAFGQAVPMSGANMTGPLTSVKLGGMYQADQFAGADFGAKLQACINGLNGTYGGTCDARNFTGRLSMSSDLNISTANVTVQFPCATISTAKQIIVTAGTRNVTFHGCALRGASAASGSEGGTVFLYSGQGAMVQVGDATYATDTPGFHIDNAVINTTGSNASSAQGMVAYRTQELDLVSLYFLGNQNQTGLTLDGTGNYTGGTFQDNEFGGFGTALNAIGHRVANSAATDWMNASTFVRLHINCPTSNGVPISGTYGINLVQGDGNTFTGGDVEGCSTALHLGLNAQNNTFVGLRNENSTYQVVADSGSSYNNWMTGGTMFTGKLMDSGTRNSFLDTFHRSFNGINGDWYGSQQDATLTNHYRIGIGTGNDRGLLNRYQTDSGYRWTTGLSDATAGEQFYQVLDELNNVYRLSIGQYNNTESSRNNQTVINAAGTGGVVLNGSSNAGTGGVVFGSGGVSSSTVATINSAGNAQFNGTLQIGGPSTFIGSTTVRNQTDAEIDTFLWAGATANQKESFIYKDYAGVSQWYLVKDASNNWSLNSATGGLDSIKAYQSTNSGDTYINSSNATGHIRLNYESGAGAETDIYAGSSSGLVAAFLGTTAIKLPGLAAGSGRNCLQIDASGYISNTGSVCGTGSGTVNGTVNAGNSGQIAYYSGDGAALAGMTSVAVTAGGTGASTAAVALANLGGQTALPGVTADGATGVQVTGAVASGKAVTAPNVNGELNEMLFPGSSVAARVMAACNSLGGASGVVRIPANETSTDSGLGGTSLLPPFCVVSDQRQIVYGKYGGIGTTPAYRHSGILNWTQWTVDSAASGNSSPTLITNHCEAQSGGYNSYGRVANIVGFSISGNVVTIKILPSTPATGERLVVAGLTTGTYLNGQTLTILSSGLSSTSVQATFTHSNVSFASDSGTLTAAAGSAKSNYQCRFDDVLSRTPGQHQTFGTQVTNYSDGDTYLWGGQVYDIGQASTPGDEGVIGQTLYLFSGQPQFSATISAINSATLTMTNTTNGGKLGEQRSLLVTSRNVYSTGTVSSIVGQPAVITGSGTSWSSLCPGGTAPCYPPNLYFEFTAETVGGIHIVMPVSQITSDTSAALSIIGQGAQTTYTGKVSSGAYSIYQGSTVEAVPYTSQVYTTVYATVADASQFQVGDSVMQVGGNNRSMNGATLLLSQNVPVQANGGSNGVRVVSGGSFPISYGFIASGAIAKAAFSGDWGPNYNPSLAPPLWGVSLSGEIPTNGFYQANDPINLYSTEKMLCAGTHLNGSNNCLQFDRTSGIDAWELANGNQLIGTDPTGNLTVPGGLIATGSISSGGSISNSAGGFGPYSNLLTYSEFDASNPSWNPLAGTSCANTVTANAAPDPNGVTTTAEQFHVAAGCSSTGQSQTPSSTLTNGLRYTFSIWAKGAAGGENFKLQIGSPNCTGPSVGLTTVWALYQFSCTATAGMTQAAAWTTNSGGATIYVWGASLIQASSAGIYAHTTSSVVSLAVGQIVLGRPVPTSTSVASVNATSPLVASTSTGAVTVSCPTCATTTAGAAIMVASFTSPTNVTGASFSGIALLSISAPITMTRLFVNFLGGSLSSCTTSPTITIKAGSTVVEALSIPNGQYSIDSGALSLPVGSGPILTINSNSGAGCTGGSAWTSSINYRMQ